MMSENLLKIEYEFTESLARFTELSFTDKPFKYLLEEGMSVAGKFPYCTASALFFYSLESFEFELIYETRISGKKQEFISIFENLIASGTVSQTLKSGTISYHIDSKSSLIEYILPLISSEGVIGLVVILSNFKAGQIDIPFLNMLSIFGGLFSSRIENHRHRENNRKNHEALDQFVAMKTMELTISKNKLGDKIEKLINNLSMSIPHEFRTPINQIIGSIHFLESYFKSMYENMDEDVYEMISDIKSSSTRLKEGFENYIYLANLSVKSENLEEINRMQSLYTEFAENVIYEYVNYKAQSAGRLDDIVINLLTVSLAIGEEYLIKIISELIGNSIKYSEKGSEITISTYFSGDFYVICFHDRGLGFKPGQIELIEAFMQFDRTVYEQQGMGLGLSIVRKIVDLYKGEFIIESIPGEYTKVLVKLPYLI